MTAAKKDQKAELRCPVVHGASFDAAHVDSDFLPNAWLESSRSGSAIFWDSTLNGWVVTSRDLALEVLSDYERFSSQQANRFKQIPPTLQDIFPDGHPGRTSLLLKDPPTHTRLRRLVNRALTPKLLARQEPSIRGICNTLLEPLASANDFDVVPSFGDHLPPMTIIDLLGLPADSAPAIQGWGDDLRRLIAGAPDLTSEELPAVKARAEATLELMADVIAHKRITPGEDLISGLLAQGPEAVSDDDVVGVLNSMLSAGIETTKAFIPTMIYWLVSRGSWPEVVAAPARDPYVEAALLSTSPVRLARRTISTDTTLGPASLKEGDTVFVSLQSVNDAIRSEANHPAATSMAHLAFGRGIHFCIGAPLARLEARCSLDAFAQHFPSLSVTSARFEPHPVVPRMLSLMVAA